MSKQTKITIETESLVILRGRNSRRAWCPQCAAEREVIALEEVGIISNLGQAETSNKDPNNENFCAYSTGLQCLPYVWQFGITTPLSTLGGTNAGFGAINNLGAVAGYAENNRRDPDCRPGIALNGTGPQVLDFEPVIWGPKPNQIRQLNLLPPSDTVGIALGLNELGQAVGTTGTCANTLIPGLVAGPHAVLWDHGDAVGAGLAINNRGDVVGASTTSPGPAGGNPRAFLWHKGHMSDLNALIPANSPMYLLTAFGINDEGQIAGFGVVTSGPDSGKIHGFLATPKY